jgi:WD40 repeat protein
MTRPSMLFALVLIAACGDDLVGPDSAGLELRTVTTGAPVDPDGYQVRVDGGAPAAIGLNVTRSVPQVGVGEHRVELEGVASHCVLAGPSLRAVTVVAGSIARVQFEVVCAPPHGSVEVSVATVGDSPDPDGYLVRLDQTAGVPVPSNGTVTFAAVAAGEHEIGLSGIALNCAVTGDHPAVVTVGSGPVRLDLEVRCGPPTGIVRIVTSTTGFRPDADGYVVTVNQTAHAVAPSGSVIIPDLPAGEVGVELTGVASNCAVGGGPSRTITLGVGTTFDVTFEVTCIAIVDGLVLFTSDRTGATHLYRVRDDGSDLRDLTPSREVLGGADWSPDGSRIVFATSGGLFVMNADGSAPAPLGVEGNSPRWSPDGERILFNAAGMITVMRADGTDLRPITPGGGAAWSPDGTRIAFARVDRSRCVADLFCPTDLYAMAPDGSGQTRLVSSANASDQLGAPAWSPDGTRIAYTRSCCFLGPNASGLYVVGVGGSLAQRVSSDPVRSGPVWSPDGRAIAIAAGRPDGSTDLMLLPSTGGSSGVVLAGSAASEYPSAWR